MTQITLLERARGVGGGAPRIETDVSDSELERMIDTENQEIIQRFGPHADPENPITVRMDGGGVTLDLLRPLDVAEDATVTEFWRSDPFGEPVQTELVLDTDYRVWFGGRTLERLATGVFQDRTWGRSAGLDRFGWGGHAGWVVLEYVPVNDGDQRAEVILQLVELRLRFNPVTQAQIGNVIEYPRDYRTQRESLLATLAPRKGLLLR